MTEAFCRHGGDIDLVNPATVDEIAAGLGDEIELLLNGKSVEEIWLEPGKLTGKARDALRSYFNTARDYAEHIDGLTSQELYQAYALEGALYEEAAEKAAVAYDAKEFYNSSAADADFSFWLKAAAWHVDKAISLSRGKDPRVVNLTSLRSPRMSTSPFRIEYMRRRWLVERAIEAGQLNAFMTPNSFIEWSMKTGIKLPPAMLNQDESGAPNQGKSNIVDITGQAKRRYNNLLRIIITLLSESNDIDALIDNKYVPKDEYIIKFCKKMKANGSIAFNEPTIAKRMNEAIQLLRNDRKEESKQ